LSGMTDSGWDILAESSCPKGRILLGDVPIPPADGTGGRTSPVAGYCWVKPVRMREASFLCVGVENLWNLVGMPSEVT
jgi:hypothetical protein